MLENLLESAGALAALLRFFSVGLSGRFLAIVAWLALLFGLDVTLIFLPQRSPAYFWTYTAAAPLECVLAIAAVREILGVIFANYAGIRSVGRWAVYGSLILAGGASLAITVAWHRESSRRSIHFFYLFYVQVLQRSVVFTLAVVILAVLFVLSRYPLHLDRNSVVSSVFFSVIFLSNAAQLLIASLSRGLYNHSADLTEAVVVLVCLAGWAALLRREEASAIRHAEPVIPPDPGEAQLLGELAALNRLLTRAARG